MVYKAALFDLDDTLVSSYRQKWAHHQHIARRHYGIDISDDDLRRAWGKPFLVMVEELYQGVDEAQAICDLVLDTHHEWPNSPFEGAADAISLLLDKGVEVGIVTSAPVSYAERDLGKYDFDIERLFVIVGEDSSPAHKPQPEVFDPALDVLKSQGVDRTETVYVGDLLVDYQAATAAGIDFIAVVSGVTTADEFRALGATHVTPGVVSAVRMILGSE
jgi:phosphoglycolate phosphatase-like HAD superfamily hydrolase